jgi:membrane-associated phospholipid phosphatase
VRSPRGLKRRSQHAEDDHAHIAPAPHRTRGIVEPVTSATTFDPAALPASLRRPAAAVAAIAALAVMVLGLRYEGLSASTRTDRVLESAVATWIPEKNRGFWLVQSLGSPTSVIVVAGLLAVLAVAAGRHRLALLAVLGPGLTGLATTGLKPLFDRTLSGEPAYPSGHTGALTALAIVVALMLTSLLRAGRVVGATLVAVAALGAGVAMAIALTALGVHYPTDTIGGFGTAVAVVLGAAVLLDRVTESLPRG